MEDDGAPLHGLAVLADGTDAALGVQHAALLGAEGRHFTPRHPAAARGELGRGRAVVGHVQGERADQLAILVVELDVRRQALAREDGLFPDQERGIGGDRGRRGPVRRDQLRQLGKPVDLVAGLVQPRPQGLAVVLGLDGVLGDDQLAGRAFGEEIHRRVEQQRRHEEGEEQAEDPRRHRRPPVPGGDTRADQRRESAHRGREDERRGRHGPAPRRRNRGGDDRRQQPGRQDQQARPPCAARHTMRNDGRNQGQRRRPHDGKMQRRHASHQRQARGVDRVDRELAQVDRDRVRHRPEQPLEQEHQRRHAQAGEQLPPVHRQTALRSRRTRAKEQAKTGRRIGEEADERGRDRPGEQQRGWRRRQPARRGSEGEPHQRAAGSGQRERPHRRANVGTPVAGDAAIEKRPGQQQHREADQSEHPRRDLAAPVQPRVAKRRRVDPGFRERLSGWRAQDHRARPRAVAGAFDAQQRGRQRRLHPVLDRGDGRADLRRREHMLGGHAASPSIGAGLDRLDVHEPQAERRWRDEQRRRA